MMKVIFFDKRRETMTSVGNVIQLQSARREINGRMAKVWLLVMNEGEDRILKQSEFEIERVEI